jgi:hypothetical protein
MRHSDRSDAPRREAEESVLFVSIVTSLSFLPALRSFIEEGSFRAQSRNLLISSFSTPLPSLPRRVVGRGNVIIEGSFGFGGSSLSFLPIPASPGGSRANTYFDDLLRLISVNNSI